MGNPTIWFPNRSDINRPVQSQKRRKLYHPSSENKGADQLCSYCKADLRNKGADQLCSYAVTAKLICAFVFAYADCWFSHGAAQIHVVNYFKKRITVYITVETSFLVYLGAFACIVTINQCPIHHRSVTSYDRVHIKETASKYSVRKVTSLKRDMEA